MSSTIQAIERHMIPSAKVQPLLLGTQSRAAEFVAEWQQRGPETLSGQVVQKLRLALAPKQSVVTTRTAG